MTAITFDTLKFANRLKSAGVPPAQAEAEAEALAEVFDVNLKDIATRENLNVLQHALTERFDARMLQLEQRMTIKLGTLMVVAVAAVAALVRIL